MANDIGSEVAQHLIARLADLWAAESVSEIPIGVLGPLDDDPQKYQIQVTPDVTLQFKPNHLKARLTDDGTPDWGRVTRIQIESISGLEAVRE